MFGRDAILIEWRAVIDRKIHKKVLHISSFVSENFIDEIIEIVPAYHSLAIYLQPNCDATRFIEQLEDALESGREAIATASFVIDIPVCYQPPFAPDIDFIAKKHSLSISEVIEKHTAPLYHVYFLGFLPGFPYLGGLDSELHTPRRIAPRLVIEKGSVGIGGKQTGIYPSESPGGWHIIGRTPLQLFDPTSETPCSIQAGDYIRFQPITESEYALLQVEVASGTFQWRKEAYDD